MSVCGPVQADGGTVRMDLNGIVDLLYPLITLGPSRSDRGLFPLDRPMDPSPWGPAY